MIATVTSSILSPSQNLKMKIWHRIKVRISRLQNNKRYFPPHDFRTENRTQIFVPFAGHCHSDFLILDLANVFGMFPFYFWCQL